MPEQIHISPDGTEYHLIATRTTTPTEDNEPKPITVRLKVFWRTTRKWTEADVEDYCKAVPQLAKQIQHEQYWDRQGHVKTNRFTCEDFALRMLVQYAALKGLPLKLTTGVRTYRNMEVHSLPEHDRYDSTMYGFADMVSLTYGAPDMQRVGLNTVRLHEPEALTPGDILAQAKDIPGTYLATVSGRNHNLAHHIQLVVSRTPSRIEIFQGNSSGTIRMGIRHLLRAMGYNPADPQDSKYGGLPVETGSYALSHGGGWDYINHDTRQQGKNKLSEFELYRWNFLEFNR